MILTLMELLPADVETVSRVTRRELPRITAILRTVDAYLAVVSKREVREYEPRPVPEEILRRILEAARATGSSKNSQPWRFIVLRDPARRRALGAFMRSSHNLDRCTAAIAIVLLND